MKHGIYGTRTDGIRIEIDNVVEVHFAPKYGSIWSVGISWPSLGAVSLDAAGEFVAALDKARTYATLFERAKDDEVERNTAIDMALHFFSK